MKFKRTPFIYLLICLSLTSCNLSSPSNSVINNSDNSNPSSDISIDTSNNSSNNSQTSLSSDVNTYYQSISNNDSGSALQNKLYSIIKGHTVLDYDDLETYMRTTDRDWTRSPNKDDENPYMVLLYYTKNNDTNLQQTWNKYHSANNPTSNQMWDKEHIWAKSNGFPNKQAAYSDLHHLRASDQKNNNSRNNYPFASLDSVSKNIADFSSTNSGKLGKANNVIAYEPLDQYKGDIARALLYMATRYGFESPNLSLTDGTDSSGGKWGFLSDLLKWNLMDQPDAFEINRNDLVYSFQHNRNPFIDHPEYACKIYSSTSSNTLNACS